MVVRARAPLRISFCGGGTDIPPFSDRFGGVVLSTTINKYAYSSIVPRNDQEIHIRSLDFNKTLVIKDEDDLQFNGELDLIKAILRHYSSPIGFDLFLHCDAPPGSGLATSSSMAVALISALQLLIGRSLNNYEIAELAYYIERKSLGSRGGKQDQFAISFGGFNFIEFYGDTTVVNSLRINENTLSELNYRLLLCYTGRTRKKTQGKGQIITSFPGGTKIEDYFKKLKELTIEMKKVLLKSQLDSFGYLLHEAWLTKQKTHKNASNETINQMYKRARKRGALGGKVLGAGGGGYLVLYCKFDKKHIVAKDLEQMKGEIIPFTFDKHGVQSWSVK